MYYFMIQDLEVIILILVRIRNLTVPNNANLTTATTN
jgi:hypothetical protein